jgi:hypothetical protein
MSKEDIIKELLQVISDNQETESISFSLGKELTSLVRMLQVG